MRRGLLSVLLLGTVLAVVGAGCGGGGSKTSTPEASAPSGFSTYETQMQQLGSTLGRSLMRLGTANRDATTAQIVANVHRAQADLRAAAVQLNAITPPAKVKVQHQLLIKGVREYADELDGVVTRLKRGDRQAVFRVTTLKGIKDMEMASTAIRKAGYTIVLGG
jgi:hypothetical protein